MVSASPLGMLFGCTQKEPLLRVASHVWPGYELIYLAREQQYFLTDAIRLIEVPSATACLQSLAAGTVEGAMLTLDEVLTARSEGLDLKVVCVLDVSLGADVLMTQASITQLSDLKGKRIGVEKSAVGAVMLDAALHKAQLTMADIETVYLTFNRHEEAFLNKEVDALVTFEPVKSQLNKEGANLLFDSSEIPGRIIDVLAVLPSVIQQSPKAIKQLIASHFKARDYFVKNPAAASVILAKRLQLTPAEVPASFIGVELPDLKQNQKMLMGENPPLVASARDLANIMHKANLIQEPVSTDGLFDASLL